jgi:hypothetical protein
VLVKVGEPVVEAASLKESGYRIITIPDPPIELLFAPFPVFAAPAPFVAPPAPPVA